MGLPIPGFAFTSRLTFFSAQALVLALSVALTRPAFAQALVLSVALSRLVVSLLLALSLALPKALLCCTVLEVAFQKMFRGPGRVTVR